MKLFLQFIFLVFFSGFLLFVERLLASGWVYEFSFRMYYLIVFSLYLFGSFFLFRFMNFCGSLTSALILFVPQLFVLLFAASLSELRFHFPITYPIVTLLAGSGILSAYFTTYKKWKKNSIVLLVTLIAIIGYYFYLVQPSLKNEALASNNLKNKEINVGFWLKQGNVFINQPDSKILIFEFWFKNCAPCKKKMVPLNELRQQFSGDTNVVFIAVNVGSIDSRSVYESAMRQPPYKYFVNMYDSAGLFASHLGLQSYPEELIVKNNKIIRSYSGWFRDDLKSYYLKTTTELIKSLQR